MLMEFLTTVVCIIYIEIKNQNKEPQQAKKLPRLFTAY